MSQSKEEGFGVSLTRFVTSCVAFALGVGIGVLCSFVFSSDREEQNIRSDFSRLKTKNDQLTDENEVLAIQIKDYLEIIKEKESDLDAMSFERLRSEDEKGRWVELLKEISGSWQDLSGIGGFNVQWRILTFTDEFPEPASELSGRTFLLGPTMDWIVNKTRYRLAWSDKNELKILRYHLEEGYLEPSLLFSRY